MNVTQFKALVKEAVKEAMQEVNSDQINIVQDVEEAKPTPSVEYVFKPKKARKKSPCPICKGEFKNLTTHYKLAHNPSERKARLELLARIRPKSQEVRRLNAIKRKAGKL